MQLIYLPKEILEIILFILGANEIFKKNERYDSSGKGATRVLFCPLLKTVYCVIHLTIGDYHFIMTQSNDQSFPTLEINSLQARGS